MQGYIKDHRKELTSDIWQMPPLYHRLWQWLKYQVNHDDALIPMTDGTKLLIKKGQHLTSVRNIAQGIGWYEGALWKEPNPKTVSRILDWLEHHAMIVIDRGRGNRQFTLITLVNWRNYQGSEPEGVTVNGEGREQLVDINKNEKNNKELKDIVFSHWKDSNLVNHRTLTPQIERQINWKLQHYSVDEILQSISTYSEILHSKEYILDTKWGLHDFLEKGHFEKFLPDRDPHTFYPKVKTSLPAAPARQSKLAKNKERLMGGVSHDRARSEIHPVQGISSLPEPAGVGRRDDRGLD